MSGIIGSHNNRGSGLVKQLTASGIEDNAITLAKMVAGTDGNVISYDASGDPVAIATGSDGQVFTSTGAGSPPAMEALSGGGKLGQIQYTQNNSPSTISTTSLTYVTTGIAVAITPVAESSKIFLRHSTGVSISDDDGTETMYEFYRDTTRLGAQGYGMWNITRERFSPIEATLIDEPSTTSEVVYTVYFHSSPAGGTAYACWSTAYFQISAMEILA